MSDQSRGHEQWAKIHKSKQAANAMNFLTENKIEQYMNLTARIVEIVATSEQTTKSLKNIKMYLANMAVLIKNVTTYKKINCTKLYTTQIFGCQIQNIITIQWFNTFISF